MSDAVQAVLDFLSSTDVGRPVPSEEGMDVGSEAPEWERRERGVEREAEAEVLGAEGELGGGTEPPVVPAHPLAYGIGRGGVRAGSAFSFVISLVRIISSWDRPGRRAKGLATCRRRADNGPENCAKCTPPQSR